MTEITTTSTSPFTAKTEPIVLRGGGKNNRSRLVFVPIIVDNVRNPEACVEGHFVYEKRAQRDIWIPIQTERLSSLKNGEGYTLRLNTKELLTLVSELDLRFQFHRQHGVPKGQHTWVTARGPIGRLVADLEGFKSGSLDSEVEEATRALSILLNWLAKTPHRPEAVTQLIASESGQLPALNAMLGLAAVKSALDHWQENANNQNDELFWKKSLKERAYVLSQVFVYPVIVIGKDAYLGGKQIDNKGGNLVDLLAKIESTSQAVLIEIKTPLTRLLGPKYRNNVYPPSDELAGGISQALKYRQTFISESDHTLKRYSEALVVGAPPCLLIAGNAQREFASDKTGVMRDDFELIRGHLQGVTVVTYDELFRKLMKLVELLENPGWGE